MAVIRLGNLQSGQLIARENRFRAGVQLGEKVIKAYVPNPGRIEELLVPGREVLVKPVAKADRKTENDLLNVRYKGVWVSIDSRLPNKLTAKALEAKELAPITDYSQVQAEYSYGNSRFDFLLTGGAKDCLVEVKSVTLVEDGAAMFPDAPTKRGRRHLTELIEAKKAGYRSIVLFIIQREDADYFTPCNRIDLQFKDKLAQFKAAAGEIYAYDCSVKSNEVRLHNRIEVRL